MTIPGPLAIAKDLIAVGYFAAIELESIPEVFGIKVPSMTGVGIEFRSGPNGELLPDLILVVYLINEVPNLPKSISSPSLGGLLPTVTVEFRVTGRFRPAKTPAPAGSSIGPERFQGISGTLGAVVKFDSDPTTWFILSCNHVLALNHHLFGTPAEHGILQPSAPDMGAVLATEIPKFRIASVDAQPPACTLQKLPMPNVGDFALAEIVDHSLVDLHPMPGMQPLTSPKPLPLSTFLANHDQRTLFKAGRQTGITKGKLHTPTADFDMSYGEDMGFIRCKFGNELFVTSRDPGKKFADDGDSGSLIVTDQGDAVGLVFAINNVGDTVVCPLDSLFSTLGLSFVLP